MSDENLTHVDDSGAARMVDVGDKGVTRRVAEARGRVQMRAETVRLIRENLVAKGDVLAVARVAGIMAAKRTDDLIPLCHGLDLTGSSVNVSLEREAVEITARVHTEGKTGVEMEALTAVTVAALTIYDMCKGVDRGMIIDSIRLTYKAGGRSGEYRAP